MLPYANIEAYKELQRRLANGEIQIPRKDAKVNRKEKNFPLKRSLSGTSSLFDTFKKSKSGSEDDEAMIISEDEKLSDGLRTVKSTSQDKITYQIISLFIHTVHA